MSGSSGGRDDGGYSGGAGSGSGGGSGGGTDPCDFVHTAPLSSPKPTVVSTLRLGEELQVELDSSGPRPVLQVHTAALDIAGSLTHTGHAQIIACIEQGHAYKAVVVEKAGGNVTVRISRT